MMLYDCAVVCGGKLSLNKNSTKEGNKGKLPGYLRRFRDYLPRELSLPIALGTLDRLKQHTDMIVGTRHADSA